MRKWIGIALAALVALTLAAAIAVSLLFDPNDYKDTVASWVEQRTGRKLAIEGDLKLSFFPWLGVTTGPLALSNPPGFDGNAFANVARVNVRVKLLPLLARRFEVGTVELDGLILNLATDARGRGNWLDLMNAESAPAANSAADSAASASINNIQVAGLRLADATIYWRENVDQVRYILRDVSLATGPLRAGAPVDLQADVNLLSVEPQFNLQLAIAAVASIDTAMDNFSAAGLTVEFSLADPGDNLRASGTMSGELVGSVTQRTMTLAQGLLNANLVDPPGPVADNLKTTARWPMLTIDLANQTLTLPALTTHVDDVTAQWKLAGERLFDQPQLQGSMTSTAAPWARLVSLATIALPEGIDPAALDEFDLSFEFSAQSSGGLTLNDARLSTLGMVANATLTLNADGSVSGRLAIPEFDADRLVKAVGRALPESVDTRAVKQLALRGSFTKPADDGNIMVPDFSVRLLGAALTGRLQMTGKPGARIFTGTIQAPPFDAGGVAQAFASLLPENLDAAELGALGMDSRFRYDQDADQLRLEDLTLQGIGLQLSGALSARPMTVAPTWTGRLTSRAFSPRELMRRFGQEVPQTADAQALSRASVSTDLVVSARGGEFKSLRLDLDGSVMAGDFSVTDYDNPRYGFNLSIDQVDVDRYLPATRTGAPEESAPGSTTDQVKVPTEALKTLNLQGQVKVGQMKLAGLSFADVATGVQTGGDGARLDSASAKLYGGAFDGNLMVDTRSRVPTISLKGSATAVQLEPLLLALRGNAMISGSGSFQLDLSGRGQTVLENVQSAAGNVEFALRDGAVKGFNLGYALCRAYNAQRKLPAPRGDVASATGFTLMRGSARIAEGIAASRNIEATSSFLAVNGDGSLDLANQGLNYDLTATLSGPIAIDGCDTMDSLVGQSIPLTLRGTIGDPKIAPDFGKLLEVTIRRRVEEELKDRLLERLGLPRPDNSPAGASDNQSTPPR